MIKGFNYYKNVFNIQTTSDILLGNEQLESILKKINHPQQNMKVIHVAGTNGKGSTIKFIESILTESGYKVGCFTSPCLESVLDQITTGGRALNDKEFHRLIKEFLMAVGGPNQLKKLSDFELLTALAIYYFSIMNPHDIVIFEAGMGGLFDSTNVITPILSIITNVGSDHKRYLGDNIISIAKHKAGIIKRKVAVIVGDKKKESKKIIKEAAQIKQSPIYVLEEDFSVVSSKVLPDGELFSFSIGKVQLNQLELSMVGKHQIENASLALMAIQILVNDYSFLVDERQIRKGLIQAYWPLRMEKLSENPRIYIDGAHNPEGMRSLVESIDNRFSDWNVSVCFSALKDKEVRPMIAMLEKVTDKIVFTSFEFSRAASANELYNHCQSKNKHVASNWEQWVANFIQENCANSVLIITGSLYFLSEVKPKVLKLLE